MRNANRKVTTIIHSYLLLSLGLLAAASASAAGQEVRQEEKNGLSTTTFNAPQGRVILRLPADIRAGDTISGTVIAQLSRSGDTLEGYVVEIDGRRYQVSDKLVKFVVPAASTSLPMILKDGSGTEVGRAAIPIVPTMSGPPSNFVLPQIGQAGRTIPIQGAFDGDATNTKSNIGGKPVDVIAESPRKVVIQIPPEPVGPTTITVTEKDKTGTGAFRNIGVDLSAPKTSLMRGEKTTVTVRVTGLEGLTQNVPMDLVTTGSVNMQGGNTQQITIKPNQVQMDGSASLTRTMTGITPGSFNVTATVIVSRK
jgi:hypothetical protein